MKKSKILMIVGIILLCVVLFTPIPLGTIEDGGTRDYLALTYRIVKWNRLNGISEDGTHIEVYQNTCIYFFPDNFKDIDELWKLRH